MNKAAIQKYIQKWKNKLGLQAWNIDLCFVNSEEELGISDIPGSSNNAKIQYEELDRNAVLYLLKTRVKNDKYIKHDILHELAHLFISNYAETVGIHLLPLLSDETRKQVELALYRQEEILCNSITRILLELERD